MTQAVTPELLAVTQEDREAAWPWRSDFTDKGARDRAGWMRGDYDANACIQAFARHRLASASAPAGWEDRELGVAFTHVGNLIGADPGPKATAAFKAAREWWHNLDAAMLTAAPQPPVVRKFDGSGLVYFNEDTGEEYSTNHPIDSGEVPDATRIRASTGQEDLLWAEIQRQFNRAEALAAALATQPADERMREAAAKVCQHVREIVGASTGSSIAMALAEASDRIRALPLTKEPRDDR